MPRRLIVAVALVALVGAASYSQTFSVERTGFHANKITRDRDAILSFSPVGVWAAPRDLAPNSPTASYVFVYPSGVFKILSTSCRVQAVARWEYDDTGYFTIIAEGQRVESLVMREAERQQRSERYNQLQRVVLACAKKEKGIVTPAAMVATARASDRVTLNVAQRQLDYMVQKGDLELHASESGVPPLVYVVPEFLTDATRRQIAGY